MKITTDQNLTTLLNKLNAPPRQRKKSSSKDEASEKSSSGILSTDEILKNKIIKLHKQGENLESLKKNLISTVLAEEFEQKIPIENLQSMIKSITETMSSNRKINSQLEILIQNIVEKK
ncbi:hypothetical protein [Microbulbifer sp. GL-2]|uniref:hypothetical protein n=1 Tax=Microbulbifer sp. GL-2 TaxID=2591606 RepID=UPI0011636E45|nr:hypothetical protein [Microbulbifer sp. GL-2]BBM00366.1 hypothetical protein GL2_04400 [Microbulbifer sp. GL-2]